jgi:ABC-type sugar transport system permease subunit
MSISKMPYKRKKAWAGFLFTTPWIIGFIFLFLIPLFESFSYSFAELEILEGGMRQTFAGLDNYIHAFATDPNYVRSLVTSLTNMVYQTPIIIMFSLFIAGILNQQFRGRIFVRAVFFLPVIIASGVIISVLRGDAVSQDLLSGDKLSSLFESSVMQGILIQSGIPQDLVTIFMDIVNNIFELSWRAGIQILIFLAGLQNISSELYEASQMEGASRWSTFWKITFPMISPLIVVNLVYTIIDNFTDYSNPVMRIISDNTLRFQFAYSAAMTNIYFVIVFAIVLAVYGIVNKRVFYRV